MRVYVAGSSDELDRVEWAEAHLRGRGIEVVSCWTCEVRAQRTGNPTEQDIRRAAARMCLDGVRQADLVWVLMPLRCSHGAFLEFGVALATGTQIVVSGDTHRSIFCSVVEEHETDAMALDAIKRGIK